tara:strand:+ start:255 stop:971 length:717 start_codon:yes stop_codon:yes gene_type:complete
MNLKKKLLAAAIMSQSFILAPVFAQDEGLGASIAFGYVGTSGNTDTDTYNLEFLASLEQEMWLHNLKFQALGASENQQAKAERYYLENKSDYNLDEDQYLYVKGSYTDDRFSGFNYQAALSTGYGRYLLKRENLQFQGFGGIGYRQNDEIGGVNEGEAIFSIGEKVSWNISENAALTHSFTAEIGDIRTITIFEIGLETNIIGDITTKLAFQARSNSQVPVGREKTDTLTSVSLVYSF